MRLVIRKDYDEVSAWVAHYIKERINQFKPTEKRPFVLGLPSGSSPLSFFHKLAEFCRAGELSFKHVVTFNMDEYVGIPR
jgi:glucosamine-6-phosphate deaminase